MSYIILSKLFHWLFYHPSKNPLISYFLLLLFYARMLFVVFAMMLQFSDAVGTSLKLLSVKLQFLGINA